MRRRDVISLVALLPLAATLAAPALGFGGDDSFAAQSAIMSAGARAAAVRRLGAVPSVGVIDLRIRYVPRFRSDEPDVSEYRISAAKNQAGINRLRAALGANPVTRAAMAHHHISIGRVVGVVISSNGSLRVFVL